MVDEHIIIHNRKVDYILLMVAVALGMISTIVLNSFSDFINVIRMFDDGSFNSNSIIVLSNYQQIPLCLHLNIYYTAHNYLY